ncbi:hypothetical protein CEXT_455641 [Caerostris extrusa]|uniref:Uncharacterized protein n=1 Tax=Caerostris extrusa TaxID=172846 RepID=A0AAV4NAL4_CAEEX|nr:hypothetical protein CEXT_455641 [Caerostris extrusa]
MSQLISAGGLSIFYHSRRDFVRGSDRRFISAEMDTPSPCQTVTDKTSFIRSALVFIYNPFNTTYEVMEDLQAIYSGVPFAERSGRLASDKASTPTPKKITKEGGQKSRASLLIWGVT